MQSYWGTLAGYGFILQEQAYCKLNIQRIATNKNKEEARRPGSTYLLNLLFGNKSITILLMSSEYIMGTTLFQNPSYLCLRHPLVTSVLINDFDPFLVSSSKGFASSF